jgi:hypothetical protein
VLKEPSKAASSARVCWHIAIPSLIAFDVHYSIATCSPTYPTVDSEDHLGPAQISRGVLLLCVISRKDSSLLLDEMHVLFYPVKLHKHGLDFNVIVLAHAHQLGFELIDLSVFALLAFNEDD